MRSFPAVVREKRFVQKPSSRMCCSSFALKFSKVVSVLAAGVHLYIQVIGQANSIQGEEEERDGTIVGVPQAVEGKLVFPEALMDRIEHDQHALNCGIVAPCIVEPCRVLYSLFQVAISGDGDVRIYERLTELSGARAGLVAELTEQCPVLIVEFTFLFAEIPVQEVDGRQALLPIWG